VLTIAGVAAFGWCVYAVYYVFLGPRECSVYVFDQGLVYVTCGHSEACRWDEVIEVFYKITYGRPCRAYHLRLAGGQKLVIPQITNFRSLSSTLRDKTQNRLLDLAKVELRAGQPVRFGSAVTLYHKGIAIGGRKIPWSHISEIHPPDSVANILLTLKGSLTQTLVGHINDVPNYFVFMALASQQIGRTFDLGATDSLP